MAPNQAIPQTGNRKRKSVLLANEELKALKSFKKTFNTDTEFAEEMGVDRVSLVRIVATGSGSDNNISQIRKVLKNKKLVAA